jgi:hypothetical protein
MHKELKEIILESRKFRSKLVLNMHDLESKNITCQNCSGVCCTKERNSMQVTPVEALDLYFYLMENTKDKNELWIRVEDAIKSFGLDREIIVKGKVLRKNYTCPLFKFESWGCPIEAHLKPFGCLGYNAKGSSVLNGENCESDLDLLKKVDKEIEQDLDKMNQVVQAYFKFHYKVHFDKMPIPNALAFLHKKLS